MMEQHFRAPVPPLGSGGSRFDAVLRRALAKDPDARFATGKALVDALRAADHARGRPYLPVAAAACVLGGGLAVVLWGRGGDAASEAPAPEPAATPGTKVVVESEPIGAKVFRDDREIGVTPLYVEVGAPVDIVVRKPGYLERRATLHAGVQTRVALVSTTLYEGVWQTPAGELRAFEHQGDGVAVSKLDAVRGPRTFFRRYEFVDAIGPVVAFASSEDVVDPHAPDEPSCHAPIRVEYRFRPEGEVLELRKPRVAMDFANGHCVVREIVAGDPQALVRADRALTDPTWLDAPSGNISNGPPPRVKPTSKTIKPSSGNSRKQASGSLSDAVSPQVQSQPQAQTAVAK
jgi:hypothetical protein